MPLGRHWQLFPRRMAEAVQAHLAATGMGQEKILPFFYCQALNICIMCARVLYWRGRHLDI